MNRTKLDYLFSLEGPAINLCKPEEEAGNWIPAYFYSREGGDVRTIQLRGNKMMDLPGLMSEFGAAFQFFEGFGENWDALDECLSYLDEWMPTEGYILLFTQPQCILKNEKPNQLGLLLKTLQAAFNWWRKPIVDNDRFNRPAKPFHSLFLVQELVGEVRDRFSRAAKLGGVEIQLCDE